LSFSGLVHTCPGNRPHCLAVGLLAPSLTGFTMKEIAARDGKSISAVEKICTILKKKTGAATLPEVVRILIGFGLIPLK